MSRRRLLASLGSLTGIAALPIAVLAAAPKDDDIPAGFVKVCCQAELQSYVIEIPSYTKGQYCGTCGKKLSGTGWDWCGHMAFETVEGMGACGAEFLIPRGSGGYPVCPHCGRAQDTTREIGKISRGILVKEGDPRRKLDWDELDRQRQQHS